MRSAVAICLLGGCRFGFDSAEPVDPFMPSHVGTVVSEGLNGGGGAGWIFQRIIE